MRMHKWTVEIAVAETWVEDGFDITDERMHDIMTSTLSWAYGHEIACKVLTRPPDEDVAKAMGYPTVKAYLANRGEK